MHLAMTRAELAEALRAYREEPRDALQVEKDGSGKWVAVVAFNHWDQTIPIVITDATPARGTR